MNLESLMARRAGPRLAIALSRLLPLRVGYWLAWVLAGLICRLRPNAYWTIRANLQPVLGDAADRRQAERTARGVFFSALRNYYDLYRTLNQPQEKILAAVDMPPESRAVADEALSAGEGVLLVMGHLGNFDLLAQSMGRYTSPIQVLTLPDPPQGFQLMNEIRRRSGLEITPLSPAALRQTLRVLRGGGVVCVGIDRPVSELDELYPFFGHPARVPSAHVRLALKTGARMIIGCCLFDPATLRYSLHLEPPIELMRLSDPAEEVRVNMRRVLDRLEAVIRRWPEQWMVFVPIWPELVVAGR